MRNAYDHPSFNPENDRNTGYRTRSLLVIPIKLEGQDRPLGVVECVNKKALNSAGDEDGGGEGERVFPVFTVEDEQSIATFVLHLAPAIAKVKKSYRKPMEAQALGSNWVDNIYMLSSMHPYQVISCMINRSVAFIYP